MSAPVRARVRQQLGAELPDGVEHPVPRPMLVSADPEDDGLVHQHDEGIDQLGGGQPGRADPLDRVEPELRGEHRKPCPEQPLGGRAQVVAPLDRREQRLMALLAGRAVGAEQPEPVAEAGQQLIEVHGAQPDRGKLDRERDALQALAQRHGLGPVPRGEGEPWHGGRGTVGEERDGVSPVRWHRQRHDRVDDLAGNVECLPARGEDPWPDGTAQQRVRELGTRVHQVLARIEDEQQLPAAQERQQRLGPRRARSARPGRAPPPRCWQPGLDRAGTTGARGTRHQGTWPAAPA